MKLIDKDAVLAIIKNRIRACGNCYILDELTSLYHTFDSIEVEEMDLDVMQRMKECPYRQVGCTMYEGKILECKGACSWVVDYPKLKELKAQKG